MFSSQFNVLHWDLSFLRVLATSNGIRVDFLQPDLMAGDNSTGNSHAHDEDQDVEVLRADLLTQETTLRALVDNINHKFQVYEGHLDKIADRLNAQTIGANRDMTDDRRRPRDDIAQGQPVNRPVPTTRLH